MAKKRKDYGKKGVRAEFSGVNHLGVREYKTKVFNKWGTRKRNERSATDWLTKQAKIFEDKGTFGNENLTFGAYVEMKKKTHLKEAIIRNGKRVAGLKGFDQHGKHYLNPLVEKFGKAKVRLIKSHDIDEYKNERLETPTYKGTPRTLATVNRELSMLRKLLNLAVRDGIINSAPKFQISQKDEGERERILDYAEQERLLQAFEFKSKQGRKTLLHLRPIIVTALDTACRFGELKKLEWKDICFKTGIITIITSNTKTAKERLIPMSTRVRSELNVLYEAKSNELVFNVKDIKNGWRKLCKIAKIEGCRFHDLRHTAITNFVNAGMRTEVAMAISGHTELRTFRRYLNFKADDFVKAFGKVEVYKQNLRKQVVTKERPPVKSDKYDFSFLDKKLAA